MLRLGAQPFGIFTKPPCAIHLTQMVPFGERGAATVTKRDVRVEREENVLIAAIVATLAEELPLQVSIVRVLDVRFTSVKAEDRVQPSSTTHRLDRSSYFAKARMGCPVRVSVMLSGPEFESPEREPLAA